ncbi:MAG: DsrE family protein [Chloroflexi bacterium]|jgi:predicted peroxiredoxin|nr:DsrE family protein [Chloroflexota bacterium]
MTQKLAIVCTHGPEDPERATIPFVLATAAQASDVEVIMGFQATGMMLAQKGCAEHVFASGFPPLKELVDAYVEAGGELFLCGPCVTSRQFDPANDFIKGSKVVNAATFVKVFTEATNVLNY